MRNKLSALFILITFSVFGLGMGSMPGSYEGKESVQTTDTLPVMIFPDGAGGYKSKYVRLHTGAPDTSGGGGNYTLGGTDSTVVLYNNGDSVSAHELNFAGGGSGDVYTKAQTDSVAAKTASDTVAAHPGINLGNSDLNNLSGSRVFTINNNLSFMNSSNNIKQLELSSDGSVLLDGFDGEGNCMMSLNNGFDFVVSSASQLTGGYYINSNGSHVWNIYGHNGKSFSLTNDGLFFYNIGITRPTGTNIYPIGIDTDGKLVSSLNKVASMIHDSIIANTGGSAEPKGFTITSDANYTVQDTDRTIILRQTTAERTITLPTPESGRKLTLVYKGDGTGDWQTDATGYVANNIFGNPPYDASQHEFYGTEVVELTASSDKWYQTNYSPDTTTVTHDPPIADAGSNQTLNPSTTSATLDGSGSTAGSGSITGYQWTQESGSTVTITSPTSESTTITGLTDGNTYTFSLTVTNSYSLTDDDVVSVTVSTNESPNADAGEDQVLDVNVLTASLDGSGSTDPDGTISSYHWQSDSANKGETITTPDNSATTVTGLKEGFYTFSLTVTDNHGATDTAQVHITAHELKPDQYFIEKSDSFNFTPILQGTPGWTDVIGDPSKEVVTATSSNSWSVSTIGTDSTLWNPDPNRGDSGALSIGQRWINVSDPYPYVFDSSVISTGFINYSSSPVPGTYNLRISGLDPDRLYRLEMTGSIDPDSMDAGMDNFGQRALYELEDERLHSLNTEYRRSLAVVFDTTHPNDDGEINLSVTGQDSTYANGSIGMISALKIFQISRNDSSASSNKITLYKRNYDTVLYLDDGVVDGRPMLVYKPYNYDPEKTYPVLLSLSGQESAVYTTWDADLLLQEGAPIVFEHEKNQIYGIKSNGDTASFITITPQTRLDEWSLPAAQTDAMLEAFKATDLFHPNDSLFLAGYSSGGSKVVDYIYSYPRKVTAAFIQSPAGNPLASDLLADSGAVFAAHGGHVFFSYKADGWGKAMDSMKAHLPISSYYTRTWARNHSGMAYEYKMDVTDPINGQNPYNFFYNPVMNKKRSSKFSFFNNQGDEGFTFVLGTQYYTKPSNSVLEGTDEVTGWGVNTISTAKWSGSNTGNNQSYTTWSGRYVLPFFVEKYSQNSAIYMTSGTWAANGANFQITGLKPDSAYDIYVSGTGDLDAGVETAVFTAQGNGSAVDAEQVQSIRQEGLLPVHLSVEANSSGIINMGVYPKSGSAKAFLSNMIVVEKYIDENYNYDPVVDAGDDQTITLPTNTATLTATANDPDGTIESTAWTLISQPDGADAAITSSGSLSTGITALTVEGDYEFKFTATDDKSASASDTVVITVNPEPGEMAVGDRILVDLGGGGKTSGAVDTDSPDANGRYWNTLPGAAGDGEFPLNYTTFVDTAGNSVAMTVYTAANGWPGQSNVNAFGNNSGVSDYPATATKDSWMVHDSGSPKDLLITLPAGTFTVKFWGARATGGTLNVDIKLDSESEWSSYNASNNADFDEAVTFTVTSDGSTATTFNIQTDDSSNGYVYIGVIDIYKTAD